jgi:hypothetical protein
MKVSIHSKTLLLDTNLLILLFIGSKDSLMISKARTLSAFVEDDYDLLGKVINSNSFNSLVTTPHIMTEVSNLLGKERDDSSGLEEKLWLSFSANVLSILIVLQSWYPSQSSTGLD